MSSVSRYLFAWHTVLAVLFMVIPIRVSAGEGGGHADKGIALLPGDAMLEQLFDAVSQSSDVVRQYQAQVYVRSQYKVHRRNVLIRLVPSMFKFYDGISDYITETVGDVQYMYPETYNMKLRALSGTFRRNQTGLYNALDYLKINVYSPTLLPDRLISPFDRKYVNYYSYYLDSVADGHADSARYCVRIVPKHKGTQLVSGTVMINRGNFLLSEMTLGGSVELVDFTLHIVMGTQGAECLLPKSMDANLKFRFLWNNLEADLSVAYDYRNLVLKSEENASSVPRSDGYDLTHVYRLKCDDSEIVDDTLLIASLRPTPLTDAQRKIYAEFNDRKLKQDQLTPTPKSRQMLFWGNVEDALTDSYTLDLDNFGRFRFSPILDIGMASYSPSNGFSYKMQFNYSRLFEKERMLAVKPMMGYNFTRKEFYWGANLDFFYLPDKLGAFTLKVGNGNRIYTSKVMDKLRQNPDTLIDFSSLQLNYFEDTYVQIGNRIELSNGLTLFTGADMHRRKAVRPSELVIKDHLQRPTFLSLQPTYVTFAPRVKLTWTPGQYYYMNGNRKVYLHSLFPTVSVDYEHGFKGILGSNGSYGRLEADVYQQVALTATSRLYYRCGGGVFTEQVDVYFVDFVNFSHNNLPIGWNDEISGTFHLLENEWYNSSRWYSRAHLTYEAPFIVLPHSRRYNGIVHSERLYFSALFTTHLHPYIEAGYGIGTYLFNLGIFTNNVNGKFHEVGCKFTFELFSGR